ncbi:MAG TPA: 30S ribosomal protein S20 [Firmicutes bacterium]|nr:30S ribosomal protein S20 [Bacillota bacterium]
MANKKSAEKRARQTIVRTLRNSSIRSSVKTSIKKFLGALTEKDKARSEELLRRAVKAVDKAAAKGVIHKNAASRHKSRLMTKFNAVFSASEGTQETGTGA